jgi:uncharacterized protein (DUF885 family)
MELLPVRLPLALLSLFLLAAPLSAAGGEDAKLEAFFKAYLDQRFRQQPLEATRLGDHRFDHQLDDVSPAARAAWAERDRHTLQDLPRQVEYKKLTRAGQIDYETLAHDLTYSLWQHENGRRFETDPRIYNEYVTDSVYLLLVQSTVPRAEAVKSIISRMAFIPRVVAAAKEGLKDPARVVVETAIRQNLGAISFYESGLFELTGETPQLSELKPAAAKVVVALKDYQQFLEKTLLPRAGDSWRIGKEKFARKLELELNAGLSADEVLVEAERESDRVERDMYVVARQLWSSAFPKKPLPPEDADGRRATITAVLAHYNREHGKAEDLVRDAKATVERIKAFITEADILRLPEPDRCQVIEMPEFQRGNSIAFLNQAPALDPKAASVYAISPPPREWDTRKVDSYLQEYNRHMLQILTIHEAYPGHYVQLAYANRNPSLIRKVLSSGAFVEGWAVYTEQVMLDQGYGGGDLVLRLNQLKWYLRSVANAVLDYRMHCTNITDDEVMEFLTKRAFQSEGEARLKVIRAKQSSCQLSTYFVGRTAFHRLRQQIEREMGDSFDLGRFHEAALEQGSPPVKYLPELVRARLKQPR